ncbi:MAG: site-2 protease family protein [Candidatus Coproplasma sp.]
MKIKIHPLFLIVMLLCAVFGGLTEILICLMTALLHECGHIFYAAKSGYECSEIKIMPYGASAVYDIEGIRLKEELMLALAGPFVNVCLCVFLAGLWWFLPESYAYTDTVMRANVAMLLVNLLPAYPLDGGRALRCVLRKFLSERACIILLKVIAATCAVGLVIAFFFTGYNLSLATLAAFLVLSVFEKPPKANLINFSSKGKLRRGIEVKYVLCDNDITFLQAFKMLEDKRYLVLQLAMDGGVADEITQDELYEEALCHSVYDRVFEDNSPAKPYFALNGLENNSPSILPSAIASTQDIPRDTPSSTAPDSDEKS